MRITYLNTIHNSLNHCIPFWISIRMASAFTNYLRMKIVSIRIPRRGSHCPRTLQGLSQLFKTVWMWRHLSSAKTLLSHRWKIYQWTHHHGALAYEFVVIKPTIMEYMLISKRIPCHSFSMYWLLTKYSLLTKKNAFLPILQQNIFTIWDVFTLFILFGTTDF